MGQLYRHFKGNVYEVLCDAIDTETTERVIVYQDVESKTIWVRPKNMFFETIDRPEYKGPRFTLI